MSRKDTIMAKNHTPEAPEFTSVKDLGYKQAATSDTLSKQAAYALEKIAGFPKGYLYDNTI